MSWEDIGKLGLSKSGTGSFKLPGAGRRLGQESLDAVGNMDLALQGVRIMREYLKRAGESGVPLKDFIKKNPTQWELGRKLWTEGFGRAQSGAAITADEVSSFRGMAPSPEDIINPAIMEDKLTFWESWLPKRIDTIVTGSYTIPKGVYGNIEKSGKAAKGKSPEASAQDVVRVKDPKTGKVSPIPRATYEKYKGTKDGPVLVEE